MQTKISKAQCNKDRFSVNEMLACKGVYEDGRSEHVKNHAVRIISVGDNKSFVVVTNSMFDFFRKGECNCSGWTNEGIVFVLSDDQVTFSN